MRAEINKIIDGMLGLLVALTIYLTILLSFYWGDQDRCSAYGYQNVITPLFDGYCTRQLSDGTTETIPVEYMHRVKGGRRE
jgi:hypothetical protein